MTWRAALRFDDSAAYERFMGRWSRAVAPIFLDWLGAPRHASWLDVGCGTGILAEALLELCAPASVHAVDPARRSYKPPPEDPPPVARRSRPPKRASFRSRRLFRRGRFRARHQLHCRAGRRRAEMRRVARPGGLLGAYVWDFVQELYRRPLRPGRCAASASRGRRSRAPRPRGSLAAAFRDAGLEQIETRTIDVCLAYANFQDFGKRRRPVMHPRPESSPR